MKQLALLLCTLLVLHLLRFDRRQATKVSSALWLPTIWMLICASKPIGIWFGGAGYDFVSGSALDRNFLTLLFVIGFIILLKRNFRWTRAIKANGWLMLMLAYMLISILWAEGPFLSFKRWFRELGAIIMAFLVLTDPAPRQAMQSLLRRTTYILIPFSLALIKYVPELGIEFHRWSGERMWVGAALQKNGLGRLCVICGFYLAWTLIRRWRGRDVAVCKQQTYAEVSLLFITLWLLKGPGTAYPATAVVVLLLGIAIYSFLLIRQAHGRIVSSTAMAGMMALIIGYGISTPLISGSFLGDILSALGRDATFTGRTAIWASLLPVASQQPILGLGFGSFWTPLTRVHYLVGEAHNGYLDVVLELGIVGLVLLSLFLLSSCRKAVSGLARNYDWASLWICLLFMTVLHNSTESSLNSFSSHLTALLVFLAICFPAICSSDERSEGGDIAPRRDSSDSQYEHISSAYKSAAEGHSNSISKRLRARHRIRQTF